MIALALIAFGLGAIVGLTVATIIGVRALPMEPRARDTRRAIWG